MLYLNEDAINRTGIDWIEVVHVLKDATKCLYDGAFVQPIKPYLRYQNPENRIIAMPGYLGGRFDVAGIKWIASFPDNINKGIKRANSVTILNNAKTGEPTCIINTSDISAIRTAGVSGLMLDNILSKRPVEKLNFGIIGFGPIGQMHAKMICQLFGDRLGTLSIYDLKPIVIPHDIEKCFDKIVNATRWEQVYDVSDVFITCTVSKQPYIDRRPKPGSIQLNVSLRDYKHDVRQYMDLIIVDNWSEVCRENTDIERMNKYTNLQEGDVIELPRFLNDAGESDVSEGKTIMFNPMGMSIYDLATAQLFFENATRKHVGQLLS